MRQSGNKIIKYLTFSAAVASAVVFLNGCTEKRDQHAETNDHAQPSADSAKVAGTPANVEISGIKFSKSVNGADSLIDVDKSGKLIFRVGEKKDYFADPNGKLSNNSAPILLTEIDNKKPFTFTAKVTPEFTENGLYNAGVLYIYVHDTFWQKLCFEQDEHGKHRVVTVRTIGTSDDNNHDVVSGPTVYMKISSDTHTVASYYSVDKKNWQMVRLYKNNYPEKIWVGMSAQCPVEKASQSIFEEISLEQGSVKDFRLGN